MQQVRTRLAVDGRVLDDRYHGIGRITEALLHQLAGFAGLDVTVFLRPDQDSRRFDINGLMASTGFDRAIFDLPLTSPLQWLRWPRALRQRRIDVALFPYHLGAALSGCPARFGIIHDCIIESEHRYSPDSRTRLLYGILTRLVMQRSTILAPSQATADALNRVYGVRPADVQVIRWGVDRSFTAGAAPLRAVAGVHIPDEYYLHVGARRPHKNVETIVAALAEMDSAQRLVLVGTIDSRFRDPVPMIARELGVTDRLIEIASVSEQDLVALYANAKAFLYPSRVEGFGLPMLEAMAAGAPVIASDISVFREVGDGAALFADVDQPSAWATAMHEVSIPARRGELIDAGRRRASESTWDAAGAALKSALLRSA